MSGNIGLDSIRKRWIDFLKEVLKNDRIIPIECPLIKQASMINMDAFDWKDLNGSDNDVKVEELPKGKPFTYRVCECGANKTYGEDNKFHAHWCPLYEK